MAKYIKWCDDVLPQWRTRIGDQHRTTQGVVVPWQENKVWDIKFLYGLK